MAANTGSMTPAEDTFEELIIRGSEVEPAGYKRPRQANSISTTKYTLLSWLPKSIWAQFRRVANVYFLGISILMLIGTYATELFTSPLDPYSTVATLIFVLLVTSVKEGFEDLSRAKSDKFENNKEVIIVSFAEDGTIAEKTVRSCDVAPGDIVKLVGPLCGVPVDLLLILTAYHGDGNKCYIETANLDGETNLKLREGPSGIMEEFPEEVQGGKVLEMFFKGKISMQTPNKNMHKFVGTLKLDASKEEISLSAQNIILRGSSFSNTEWGYGIALYTGQNTKIQLNGRNPPTKMSKIEGYLNNAIIIIFMAQCVLVSISVISLYAMGFQNLLSKLPYVYPSEAENGTGSGTGSVLPLWLEQWIVFFLLYNNFIPISLYVTIEMVNVGQAYLIANDDQLYRKELDVPCAVRSSNLVQELGGVSNIFSDKTGTLTCNEMRLVKFVLNGQIYDIADKGNDDKTITEKQLKAQFGSNFDAFTRFCRCLVTCHTVVRESDGTYRAESPDELALVEAVGNYNCFLEERGSKDMFCKIFGQESKFEVLAVNAFDSDRKRMSVLLRLLGAGGQNQYFIMCKGADNIMLPLCTIERDDLATIDQNLTELSNMGLRTLVIAQKEISEDQALAWLKAYKAAAASAVMREEKMAAAGGELEVNMQLVGLTAIEDRLQDEVPEVIADLAAAGIILWMLTGDKLETAIMIGRSCNLILEDTKLVRITGKETPEDFYQALKAEYEANVPSVEEEAEQGLKDEKPNTVLVLDGPSFAMFNEIDLEQRHMLLRLTANCRAVVSCRLTPTQKKDLVNLVKIDTFPKTTTLAIGDGANDVAMIMEADVGVGIYGKEGRQAANNADFAIGEFKFLRRLLLVHGRWNYIRQARVFLYCMHKNMVLTLTLFWFSYYDAVSGTSLYESWIYSAFNLVLGLPIIFYGILDRDISADFALKHPETYSVSRQNSLLQNKDIGIWILNAAMYAIVLCLMFLSVCFETYTYYGYSDLYSMGTTFYAALCMALQLKVGFLHHQWAYPQILSMTLSVVGMLLYFLAVGVIVWDYWHVGQETLAQGFFWWWGMFTVPLVCIQIDTIGYYGQWLFTPTPLQLQRECENHDYFSENWSPIPTICRITPTLPTDSVQHSTRPNSPSQSRSSESTSPKEQWAGGDLETNNKAPQPTSKVPSNSAIGL